MCNRIELLEISVPTYGLLVFIGVIVVLFVGMLISWHRNLDINSFFKLFIGGGLSSIVGAKFLYLFEEDFKTGEWNLSFEHFKESGYSFYGGMIFGVISIFFLCKILTINFEVYTKYLIFLVPLLHAFWKVGCFMGGCCYGIEYHGIGSIVFPEGVKAPPGVPLVPVQLIEAGILFTMAIFFLFRRKSLWKHPVLEYFTYYAISRFFIEFLRDRQIIIGLSLAQWLSIVLLIIVGSYLIFKNNREKNGGVEDD